MVVFHIDDLKLSEKNPFLSDQVHTILVNNKREETKVTQGKVTLLSRDGFGKLGTRVGEVFNDKIVTEGNRYILIIVYRDVCHTCRSFLIQIRGVK